MLIKFANHEIDFIYGLISEAEAHSILLRMSFVNSRLSWFNRFPASTDTYGVIRKTMHAGRVGSSEQFHDVLAFMFGRITAVAFEVLTIVVFFNTCKFKS